MSVTSESSEEEVEVTALEYARRNHLAYNHLTEHIPHPYDIVAVPEWFEGDLVSDLHLPQFEFLTSNTDERLSVSKDAAIMIAWVSNSENSQLVESSTMSIAGHRHLRNKKLELPLLKSDHERDCRDFAGREGFETELKDVKLPFEVIDEDKDEGLTFSASLWGRSEEVMAELKKEKLAVTKEAIFYLQQISKTEWDEAAEKEVWASVQIYRRNQALEPITPPLSPLLSTAEPFEPSSSDPAFQMPILSDPPSLTIDDLTEVETAIFESDIPTPVRAVLAAADDVPTEETKLGDLYSPLASMDGISTPPSLANQRMKRELLKVEETLTPTNPPQVSKNVHFSNIIEEMVFKPASPSGLDTFDSTFFDDAFGDAGEKAMRCAEQEPLVLADAVSRVEVPLMDFSLPDPPWKGFGAPENTAALQHIQQRWIADTIGSKFTEWPLMQLINQRLKWNPVPYNMVHVTPEEGFQINDEIWKVIVKGPGDDSVIDTSSLTWKPPGLRILQDDDVDDEIEPGQFLEQVAQNLSYLVKKRKMEIEEENTVYQDLNSTKEGRSSKVPKNAAQKPLPEVAFDDTSGLLGSAFSLGASLDNFLELRGIKKQKLAESSYFSGSLDASKDQAPTDSRMSISLPIRLSPVAKLDPLPVPSIIASARPINIIVSSSLFKNRTLIKRLEAQLPLLKIIERDFTAHNTTSWMPNSITRSPIASPLSAEADFILSPLTGVILTNLQKIKQKPLPGQKAKSVIRERLERVNVRYEKLIVLVSEGRNDETTRGIDASDSLAFGEFMGFAMGLDTSILVHFVGGEEETLSKWLVSNIIQHSSGSINLIEDETHWELFLRRAGLNAFAAQAIIGDIKAPEGVDPQSPSKAAHFGLTGFVEMGVGQRRARFSGICGTKLMERVSAVVDTKWE